MMRPFFLVALLLLSFSSFAQKKYYMSTGWSFSKGDSIGWAECNYPDKTWKKVDTGKSWDNYGFSPAGYGWYRYHLSLPRELKSALHSRGFIKINLGCAHEAAQYFFNGRGLGQSGSLPPRFIKAPSTQNAEFYISEDEIRWDTLNIISIRVFSSDSSSSGIVKGPLFYYVPERLE